MGLGRCRGEDRIVLIAFPSEEFVRTMVESLQRVYLLRHEEGLPEFQDGEIVEPFSFRPGLVAAFRFAFLI